MAIRGELDQVARGLYRVPGHPLTEHVSTTAVLKRVPGAVLRLLSALHFHNVGTPQPHAVWIALGRQVRKPRIIDVPALKDAVGRRLTTPAELEHVAGACRARTVMRPYLEVVSA